MGFPSTLAADCMSASTELAPLKKFSQQLWNSAGLSGKDHRSGGATGATLDNPQTFENQSHDALRFPSEPTACSGDLARHIFATHVQDSPASTK